MQREPGTQYPIIITEDHCLTDCVSRQAWKYEDIRQINLFFLYTYILLVFLVHFCPDEVHQYAQEEIAMRH